MNRRPALLSLLLLPLFAGSALAQPVTNLLASTTVTFAPGTNSAALSGQLAPAGRALYFVQAKAGQTLMVSIAPPAPGLAFQVFRPDSTLAKGTDGMAVVTGATLPDAGPNDKATAWIGAIPRDGNYIVLVGMAAGAAPPAPYSLTMSLK
jgi:hypothetical protein